MGTKVGFSFIALPRRRHAAWVGLQNAYGNFLFAPLFELAEGAPIQFHGADWRVWLCRTWCISGKARSPICKALDELLERDVIRLIDGRISVLFSPDQRHCSATERGSEKEDRSPEVEDSGSEHPHVGKIGGSHLDSSVGNHSTPEIQTDRQTKTDKTELTAANLGPTGIDPIAGRTGGYDGFAKSFSKSLPKADGDRVFTAVHQAHSHVLRATMSPAMRKSKPFNEHAADILLAAELSAAATGEFPAYEVQSVLLVAARAFYEDDSARQCKYPFRFLAERFADYFRKGRFAWTDSIWSLKEAKPEQFIGSNSASSASLAFASGERH